MGLFIIIGIIVFILIFVIVTYNKLIKLRNKVKNSWAHIDAQLQRRFDLIPNLVEVVRNFAEHEQKLLENVIAIRSEYFNANTNQEKLAMDAQLTSLLKSLYNISEHYPNLRSNRNFLQLQEALTEIEEDISYARQFYNDAVTIYNNKLMYFPSNIIASMFNFKEEVLFDAVKGAEIAPTIRFKKIDKCPNCGASISNNSNICEYCGHYF